MPRLLIIVKTHTERDQYKSILPQAVAITKAQQFEQALSDFHANPDGILICRGHWMVTGFSVPDNTLIVMGPGFSSAEYVQGFGRARNLKAWQIEKLIPKRTEYTEGN